MEETGEIMSLSDPAYYKLLEIIYEYFTFVGKVTLPTSLHEYVHEKIEKGILPDLWGDWQYLGWTWYSWSLDEEIQQLIRHGILEKTCTDDGRVCGLIKLSERETIHISSRKILFNHN